jgi:hypothetical protein
LQLKKASSFDCTTNNDCRTFWKTEGHFRCKKNTTILNIIEYLVPCLYSYNSYYIL